MAEASILQKLSLREGLKFYVKCENVKTTLRTTNPNITVTLILTMIRLTDVSCIVHVVARQ